jgi:hypothetical protein
MNGFHDAAYNMAAVSATVALYRALIKKGVLAREEAVRILLDEAVARATSFINGCADPSLTAGSKRPITMPTKRSKIATRWLSSVSDCGPRERQGRSRRSGHQPLCFRQFVFSNDARIRLV